MDVHAEDPLVAGRHRFPVVAASLDYSDELPTSDRPFILRRATVVTPAEVRHRTPSHSTKIPQRTPRDNRMDDDSYTVPDD